MMQHIWSLFGAILAGPNLGSIWRALLTDLELQLMQQCGLVNCLYCSDAVSSDACLEQAGLIEIPIYTCVGYLAC